MWRLRPGALVDEFQSYLVSPSKPSRLSYRPSMLMNKHTEFLAQLTSMRPRMTLFVGGLEALTQRR